MPQVSRNNLIGYIPQVYQLTKGQSHSITVILYQNAVGNQIEAYTADLIEVKIFDKDLVYKQSYTTDASQIIFGSTQAGTEGHITFAIPQSLGDLLADGSVYAEIKYVTVNNSIILPKLRMASISASGGSSSSGAVVGNTFTIPAPIYNVQSFLHSSNDLPTAGKIVLDSSNPASVTKIVFNNTDTRGKRNSYLENFLVKRFTAESAAVSIAITDTSDTSIYNIYKITGWIRKDLDLDGNTTGITDGIEITVTHESSAVSATESFPFTVGQRVGLLLDAVGVNVNNPSGGSISVIDTDTTVSTVSTIDFGDSASVVDGGNGIAIVTVSGGGSISATDGTTSIDPITGLSFSTGFTITNLGSDLAQIEHVANFNTNQVGRLKELVYENGVASLSVSPTSFEKNLTSGVTLTFNYSTTANDDTVQSATYDGSNVTSNPTGSSQYVNQKTTLSKNFGVTFLNADGITTRIDNNGAGSIAINPQWYGASSTADFNSSSYSNLNSNFTKFVSSSPAKTAAFTATNEYVYFLSTKSNATIYDGNNFNNTSDFTKTTVSVTYEDGTALTLYQYRTNLPKTLSAFTYRIA